MPTSGFFNFKGIDRRRSQGLADMDTAFDADNLVLTGLGKYVCRPGTEKVAQLPVESKGLYSVNESLRTVAPAGYADIFNQQTPLVVFDFISPVIERTDLEQFHGVERFGIQRSIGVQPYVSVTVRGEVEYHWITDRPDTPADDLFNTKVDLPFVPQPDILKLVGKVFGIDQANGYGRFSSTVNGPDDFVEILDAGFLANVQFAPNSHTMTALGHYRGRLVVFFEDSLQVWGVDVRPENMTLAEVMDGPGTLDHRSVVNARGDLLFLSRGGFRSLTTTKFIGELQEGDFGAPVFDLIKTLPGQVTAACWWQTLGVYLVAFGTTVYCWKNDPLNKVKGWTRWELPVQVTDFAELSGDLYFRGDDDGVYRFNLTSGKDEGVDISWKLRTPYLHMNSPGTFKTFRSVLLFQQGRSTVTVLPDPNNATVRGSSVSTSGNTQAHERIPVIATNDAIALELAGDGYWELDGFSLDYDTLRL